jgi:hypothetical protein
MNLPWYLRKIFHFSLVLSPSRPKISGASAIERFTANDICGHTQGCQIFLGATYQNGKNIPMCNKYTKLP